MSAAIEAGIEGVPVGFSLMTSVGQPILAL